MNAVNGSRGKILILGTRDDAHLPYVIRHLDEEPMVIDTKRLIFGDHLTYRTARHGSDVLYMGEPIGNVQSVWYRDLSYSRMGEARVLAEQIRALDNERTIQLGLEKLFHDLIGDTDSIYWATMLPVEPKMREYARSGLNRLALDIGYTYPNAFWISRVSAVVEASYKMSQIKLAQQCGFVVPDTIATSDPEAAMAFLREHRVCVMKPLSLSPPAGRNQYTQKIYANDPPNFSGLHLSPQIFQELVQPVAELRVTIIGDTIFTCEVFDTAAQENEFGRARDWRVAFEKGTFGARRHQLPEEVEEQCLRLKKQYRGLVCGMYDLILDKQGNYVFLEMNPNGAWGFIEDAIGYPIGQTIAKLLVDPSSTY